MPVDEHGFPLGAALARVDPVVDFGDDKVVIPDDSGGREVGFVVGTDVEASRPACSVARRVAGRRPLHEAAPGSQLEGGILGSEKRRHGIAQADEQQTAEAAKKRGSPHLGAMKAAITGG